MLLKYASSSMEEHILYTRPRHNNDDDRCADIRTRNLKRPMAQSPVPICPVLCDALHPEAKVDPEIAMPITSASKARTVGLTSRATRARCCC